MSRNKLKVITIASAFSVISFSLLSQASFAQNAIAPDNTLPNNTLVNFNNVNRTYTITGGTQVGVNQFHSFQDFSVPTGNTAHFDTLPTTVNAISRVTGANISNIDGLIKANGTTNLYLINPNGIVFGKDARLEIGGSFEASTANSFKFPDGSEFSATNPQAPPLLNVNVPLGLQYGKSNAGAAISNRGNLVAGQNLVLNADKLDLQGSLQAGRDLTLQAQDSVKIRDTFASPFWAVAGRDLLVQGNQSVDIFALNNVNSGFWSGGNMVLRSPNPVIGDAHFYAGGNLTIKKLDGSLGKLLSPHDPVILAGGDVALDSYTGASLHILAGGSIAIGDVTIEQTGDVNDTISPNNTTLFNATKSYADLATFNLTDYRAVKNSDGTIRDVIAANTPIAIDGSTQATLDLRSGVDWTQLGGLPTSPTILGTFDPASTHTDSPTNADITVNGSIRVSQPNGLVLLTNQFKPNALNGAIAINGDIDTSIVDTVANGGDIRVYGRGNISIGNDLSNNAIALYTSSDSFVGDSGNGGKIVISSDAGNISLFNTNLNTYSYSNYNNSGNGGDISLSTNSGSIILKLSVLDSHSTVETYPYIANAGSGGAISLVSKSGDIKTNDSVLNSSSNSDNGSTKDGGNIAFSSYSGNIALNGSELNSFSNANSGSTDYIGNGGNISLATYAGDIVITTSGLSADSFSDAGIAGKGGAISIASDAGNVGIFGSFLDSPSFSRSGQAGHGGDISLLANSGNITLKSSPLNASSYAQPIDGDYSVGNAGDGGAISFATNSGAIRLEDSILDTTSRSKFGNSGNGGKISFFSDSGDITLQYFFYISEVSLRSYAYSQSESLLGGNTGNGGAISFQSNRGNIQLDDASLDSTAFSFSGNPQNGGAISFITNTGNLTLNSVILDSRSFSYDPNTFTQNGGAISMYTIAGNITLDNTTVDSRSRSDLGTAGDGGAIAISSTLGNISLNNSRLFSYAISRDGDGGNGGPITLAAPNGSIISDSKTSEIISIGISITGLRSGDGGKMTLTAKNQINNLDIFTLSSSGQAGKVEINGMGDLTIANLKVSTSKEFTFPDPTDRNNPTKIIVFDTGKIGSSGDIAIAGLGSLTFSNSLFYSATQGIAPAGNILITSPSAIALQNSQILSTTNSSGNAGVISIQADRSITIQDNTEISAKTTGLISNAGKAGDILLKAPTVTITGGSQVLAETNGNGAGGNVTINAPTSVSLVRVENAFPVLSVQTSNAGKAGNILIDTSTLTLSDQARITATATSTSTNKDGGGSITLNASTMNLFGTVGVFAETKGIAPAGTLFLNPYNNDTSLNIALAPNSQISASTSGSGNGGSIFVAAPEAIAITGQGKLAVETSSFGNAGNIRFTTGNLTLSDGVLISASTSGAGKAGDISMRVNNLILTNGASIQTTTSGTGDSGKIEAIASNSFVITGTNTGLFANTETDSTGKGGNIFIDPPLVSITNGAAISVNSLGKGNGGNIDIFAGKFVFANNAFLLANTASGEGGNINLQIADIFFPRNNSNITATAGGTGNGGNINLSSLFTIAIPSANNDIFANASFGKGGNINLTTQAIFGLQFRSSLTLLSDITASSEFGVQGNVNINTPGVDPSKGLTNLPVNISDASKLVTQKCLADRQGSAFVITGRGGIAASPADVISGNNLQENLGTPSNNQLASQSSQLVSQSSNPQVNRIVEAQGWTIKPNGQVSLVSEVANAIPAPTWARQLQCR